MIEPVTDSAVLEGYNQDALGYRGTPEGLYRPRDERDVLEIVGESAARRRGLTPTALRSSTTGACVCHRGFLLSTEKLNAPPDVRPETLSAVVQPGVNLGWLKRELEGDGLFFPPDPTSENDCTVGGAAATNASGARTLKYGPMRGWVRRVRVALPTGHLLEVKAVEADKNAAGYFGFNDPVQFFVGSEGTLGVITELELRCLPMPAGYAALCAFFSDEGSALDAAVEIRRRTWPVRCLEYFDGPCIDILRREKRAPLPACGGMLFFEEETAEGEDPGCVAERWLPRLEGLGALADDTILGDTASRKAEMRDMRHAVPAFLNERGIQLKRGGGGKLSSDWAVRFDRLPEAVRDARSLCREAGVEEVYCFGHVGNGHPHFNLLVPDHEVKPRAKEAMHGMCRMACDRGGTVSAEHGIGKVKKEFLRYSIPDAALEWMKGFKRMLDPGLIMAPGNVFDFR